MSSQNFSKPYALLLIFAHLFNFKVINLKELFIGSEQINNQNNI